MTAREEKRVKKRKKVLEDQVDGRELKKRQLGTSKPSEDTGHKIDDLETQILESQKNYNKINELLEYAKDGTSPGNQRKAWLALCTIFSHFLADGKVPLDGSSSSQDSVIGRWLGKRYQQYYEILLQGLFKEYGMSSRLLVQLVKEEASNAPSNQIWTAGLFAKVVNTLLGVPGDGTAFREFATEHILPFKDTRMYACRIISTTTAHSSMAIDQIISLLTAIPLTDKNNQEESACLAKLSPQSKRKHPSNVAYKKTIEETWLVVLRNDLTLVQRRRLLGLVPDTVAPWFSKPEMLTDFLIDSFNAGGAESLTALSGMFYLIQHRNLDYPQFYTKVYSMIDQDILHSKQRSRFLRLMMIFLSSTHLPAALVASFMKRLSRLCLYAPPSAIIAIVPWLYNMIKEHPVCAIMIQRRRSSDSTNDDDDAPVGEDPFIYEEADPMHTNAINSSLWEIDTLSTHFHPNVATIASIISKPFTKQSYKVEDFLDYTYDGMLESELSKALKRTPVVEFQIPKRIFTKDSTVAENELPRLTRMWDFGS